MSAGVPAPAVLSPDPGPAKDWVPRLADAIREDRVDQPGGCSESEAMERAVRYREWLEHLPKIGAEERARFERIRKGVRLGGDIGFHRGAATVITARMGAGKTNAVAFLMEKALAYRPDWDVYTNVPFPWSEDPELGVPAPPRLFVVSDMVGLLRGVATSLQAGHVPAVVIDETDQAFTSHDWATNESESWMRFIFIERHLRVRGPILVYHLYEHVPLPLRREGALRGSYLKVIVRGGRRWIIRKEDKGERGQGWAGAPFRNQPESVLPFYTLGLRGFDLNVDMGDLETRLKGSGKKVAAQIAEYLNELEETRREEREIAAAEARIAHEEAVTARNTGLAERHEAHEERLEEIIRAFIEDPNLTLRDAAKQFHSSYSTLVDLKATARRRLRQLHDAARDAALHATGYGP